MLYDLNIKFDYFWDTLCMRHGKLTIDTYVTDRTAYVQEKNQLRRYSAHYFKILVTFLSPHVFIAT